MTRQMSSYSCVDGIDCEAGRDLGSSAHRGVVNATQFWSADYLRISRYTAGPLFLHPALDRCRHFLKIDTDFYFTAPLEQDPIAAMRQEGTRLAYWQIHVQGQRQSGYMDAAVSFLEDRGLPIRNRAFYARGRFEEKAEKLGIPVSEVPEALEAATVVYGCLFGGDVHFFREPLYRDFFHYMDAHQGFELAGWSNQFFLGTAAAAFLFPSQVQRLYIAGKHQESQIGVADGNVTEFLQGASHGVFR
uniref:Nucleotide-diphospho-sugar transferase domain-containing protein n=1 Tax=Alexandrium catenella TaxID=2925 RepID=A0A7S1PLG6_ALECA